MNDKKLSTEDSEISFYGDPDIASADAPVPKWLTYSNYFWVVFGFFWLYLFWNGSYGWFDRGYWNELQRAANTTFPFTTQEIVEKDAAEAEHHKG
jgi:hypothetical protein